MAFLKRLGFYLVGLSIGIVFLSVFFKKKSEETGITFCYMPNCRTLKNIRSKPLNYTEAAKQIMLEQKLDTATIKNILTNGDVDFGKSDTSSEPCKSYLINGSGVQEQIQLHILNCPEKATVSTVSILK